MNFFYGRYGNDALGIFLFVVSFIFEIVGNITHLRFLYYIGIILFVFMFARMLSRNIFKRQRENEAFLRIWWKVKGVFSRRPRPASRGFGKNGNAGFSQRTKDNTVYCYYNCPECGQQVRIPAGRGNVQITCPRCHHKFGAVS